MILIKGMLVACRSVFFTLVSLGSWVGDSGNESPMCRAAWGGFLCQKKCGQNSRLIIWGWLKKTTQKNHSTDIKADLVPELLPQILPQNKVSNDIIVLFNFVSELL